MDNMTENKKMPYGQKSKIVVLGAGAIGSIVGGLLAKAGEDVTLIGRKAYVDNINMHGLIIDGIMGEMISSSLLTLVFIPVVYSIVDDIRVWAGKLLKLRSVEINIDESLN